MDADRDLLPPGLAELDVAALMREVLAGAEVAGLAGEVPIGAVVVERAVVSRGRSRQKERRTQLTYAKSKVLWTGGASLWERLE